MDALSDAEVHARILAGDERALEIWQDRVRPGVLAMLGKTGLGADETEELWNETLEAVWGRVGRTPPIMPLGEGLRRYTFGVARRRAAHRWADARRRVDTVPLTERDAQRQTPGGPGLVQPSRLVHAFRRCMEMVPERVRRTVEYRLIEATDEDIATALGIKRSSVSQTVARAIARIEQCIRAETDV